MRRWSWVAILVGGSSWAQSPPSDENAPPLVAPAEIEAMQPAAGDITQPPTAPPSPAAAARASGPVMDTLDLGTTSITGTQELPKVLYIVPWKRSDLGEVIGRPVNTLLDEVLAPVDPEVFERHLEYYDALYGEGNEE
jgi:hypothetical protein